MLSQGQRTGFALLVSLGLMVSVLGVARSQAGTADLALVGSGEGIRAVNAATGEVTARVTSGVANPDGSMLASATVAGGRTAVTAVDPAGGGQRWSREVDGAWAVRLVAPDGQAVVLGAPGGDALYGPVPRARTRLLVVGRWGEPRTFELQGNFEPEALALDGDSMFVISYLPPLAPDRYQVRRLDFPSGEVVDVFTPDAHLQEAMGGTARNQVWAPDGRRLYTLYTTSGPSGEQAFVHVLDLAELWAHCIDLPGGMATADESAVAMALAPDDRLYVADRAWRRLAEVDTAALTVVRSAALPPAGGFEAAAAVVPDGRLLLASGERVDVLARDTLEHVTGWDVDGEVAGFQLVRRGEELLVVLRDGRLLAVDPRDGTELRRFQVPGAALVDTVGGSSKRVPAPRQELDCAC